MKHHSSETDRVRRNTAPEVLDRLDASIEANIETYRTLPKARINARIRDLEREWSMERYLETNASALGLATVLMGIAVNRRWLLLTGTICGFLMQHALQGWCPPVPVFRRLGVRTRGEIDREMHALKSLRGDYRSLQPSRNPRVHRRRTTHAVAS